MTLPDRPAVARLQGLTLRYGKTLALDDVTLDVPAGQTVALVGPSGAGKSSLVHLLPRFIEPTAGQLLLDGVPLKDWQVGSLRQQLKVINPWMEDDQVEEVVKQLTASFPSTSLLENIVPATSLQILGLFPERDVSTNN